MTEIADRYRRLAGRFSAVLDALDTAGWAAATPCEGWTPADVAEHVATTQLDILGNVGLDHPTVDRSVPATAWAAVRDIVQGFLDEPAAANTAHDGFFGPSTLAETIDSFYSFDLLVHTWDVARGAGLAHHEPMQDADVSRYFEAMRALADNMRAPGLFGDEITPPDGADEQTRFLCFLGRDV